MPAVQPPICEFGWKARDFQLKGVDGKTYSLKDVRGPKGTLVVFMCNHCPFVKAIIDRLVEEVAELKAMGFGVIGIMPNDVKVSPGNSFDNMKTFAAQHKLNFPYVIDETQSVARAWEAVCTPDFFGFNAKDELQYRGRMDESRMQQVQGARRELHDAMTLIADTGHGPKDQIASMGCSIKWG